MSTEEQATIEDIQSLSESVFLLQKAITKDYSKIVSKLTEKSGNIITTGMGKMSYLCKKFASSLCSIGIPSLFMHPSEALHGDLGLIQKNDTVLLVSNSGATKELIQILAFCNSNNIYSISITSSESSKLGSKSNLKLFIPPYREIGFNHLAPTTSTTCTLALMDVIIASCSRKVGLNEKQFHRNHPSGTLGRKTINLLDIMHTGERIPLIGDKTSLKKAIISINEFRFGCVGITDKLGALIGIFTDGDLRRNIDKFTMETNITEIMTKDPLIVEKDFDLISIARLMHSKKVPSVFICENLNPIGFLHIQDLLNIL